MKPETKNKLIGAMGVILFLAALVLMSMGLLRDPGATAYGLWGAILAMGAFATFG